MVKRLLIASVLVSFVLCGMSFAKEDPGYLNVITDMDDAIIYVDGEQAGKSFVKNYALDPGSHYLMVKRNDKKIYAETLYIYSGETKTIPTSHFVNIVTSTPNRGALDVEAARIKETRGSGAFGIYMTTPAAGISFKYWVAGPFGLQVIGYAAADNLVQDTQAGGRLLYSLGTKILFEQPMEAYWALGAGNKSHIDKVGPNDYNAASYEFSLGLEFGIGNLYFSGETGIENITKKTETSTNMKIGGGVHYYF